MNQVQTKTIKSTSSIKTKLIAVMVAVAAVPLLISIMISFRTSTSRAKNDALEILESQAKLIEQEYTDDINKNIIALQTFANTKSTQEFMAEHWNDTEVITEARILKELEKLNNYIDDGNSSIVLSSSKGDAIIRTDGNEGNNIYDRDYFQECITTGKPAISNIITSQTTGNRVQNIIIPIYDKSGVTVIGTIHRSYNLDNMHDFLAENISDGYIVDRNGIVAAHAQFAISPEDEPLDMSDSGFMSSTESSGLETMFFDGVKTYTAWVREPVSGYIVTVSRSDKEVMSTAKQAAMTVVIIGFVLVLAAIIISLLMANQFTKPIEAVSRSLAALAEGRFVKEKKYEHRKDEFGKMSRATNSVITTLSSIVSGIKESSNGVKKSSEDLSDMADQISQTAEDVSNAVQEIATGATQQAEEIQNATENASMIGDAVEDVKSSAANLTGLADKMKLASEVSGKSLEDLQSSSTHMTVKIDEISSAIRSTQDAVNTISEKVAGITSIATQTNLLSLNASIEAARAGDAGRGFAVVAEEIGKLADSSKLMADEIKKEMDALLLQSNAAVVAADEVRQGNGEQQIALSETLEAVTGMISDIRSTIEGVVNISKGADTCDTSKNAVVDIVSSLSAISQENAASSEETGASMEELSATVTTLAAAANDLKDIAAQLSEKIAFFKEEA